MRRSILKAAALVLTAGLLGGAPMIEPATAHVQPGHTITYDRYSLMIDGERVWLWTAEFHYFRLPDPDLWRDQLEKFKATGFNAVSLYFSWEYHSPAPGLYDFSGVRDIDRLLDIAQQVGLYVIARPGPYINAELDSGGYPGWLTTQLGRARTQAADYRAAWEEWVLIFINGWNVGQYINDLGPQRIFTLPRGILLHQGENTIALAVWSADGSTGGLGPLNLEALGNYTTSPP